MFLGKTLYSQCLSPPRCINGYQQLLGENLTNCGEVTCNGLASHPGEVLLAASCYRNRDIKALAAMSQLGSNASPKSPSALMLAKFENPASFLLFSSKIPALVKYASEHDWERDVRVQGAYNRVSSPRFYWLRISRSHAHDCSLMLSARPHPNYFAFLLTAFQARARLFVVYYG